jgi:hypothetical protein
MEAFPAIPGEAPMRARRMRLVPLVVLAALLARPAPAEEKPPAVFMDMPLLHSEDFEPGKADAWEPSDPAAWKVDVRDGNHFLCEFVKLSNFKPAYRSPLNRALLKDLVVGDFVFETRLQSTIPDYPHRDLCLFFGYQDDSHLYYAHLGKRTDDAANQIHIVNGAPRRKITTKTTAGTPWDDAWHTARVVRKVSTGLIEVYFDDLKTPIMTAEDKTFTRGRVGVGSFDDTGNFDDVRLWGVKSGPPK